MTSHRAGGLAGRHGDRPLLDGFQREALGAVMGFDAVETVGEEGAGWGLGCVHGKLSGVMCSSKRSRAFADLIFPVLDGGHIGRKPYLLR